MTPSRQHMLECEARSLLRMPLATRRAYLAAAPVQARREKLQDELVKQHELKQVLTGS